MQDNSVLDDWRGVWPGLRDSSQCLLEGKHIFLTVKSKIRLGYTWTPWQPMRTTGRLILWCTTRKKAAQGPPLSQGRTMVTLLIGKLRNQPSKNRGTLMGTLESPARIGLAIRQDSWTRPASGTWNCSTCRMAWTQTPSSPAGPSRTAPTKISAISEAQAISFPGINFTFLKLSENHHFFIYLF